MYSKRFLRLFDPVCNSKGSEMENADEIFFDNDQGSEMENADEKYVDNGQGSEMENADEKCVKKEIFKRIFKNQKMRLLSKNMLNIRRKFRGLVKMLRNHLVQNIILLISVMKEYYLRVYNLQALAP